MIISLTNQNLTVFNSLNAELNPICHLLALLGAHHFLHVSTIRVNLNKELGYRGGGEGVEGIYAPADSSCQR